MRAAWLVVAVACGGEPVRRSPPPDLPVDTDLTFPSPTDSAAPPDTAVGGDTAVADPCDAPVNAVSAWAGPVTTADLEIALSSPVGVAVWCAASSDPDDAVLVEVPAPSSVDDPLAVRVRGLAPDTAYACDVLPACPDAEAVRVDVVTVPLPDAVPRAIGSLDPKLGTTGPPFALMNAWRFCAGDPQVLVAYDLAGTPRWVDLDVPGDVDGTLEVRYLGDGLLSWGGGLSINGDLRVIDLDGAERSRVAFPGSDAVVWHHDAACLPDGTAIALAQAANTDGVSSWTGFALHRVDVAAQALVWTWTSQVAVDAGRLGPGEDDDPYHANAVSVVGDTAVTSLCKQRQILGIDMNSGGLAWVFGPDGDLSLRDASGAVLADDAWPQCTHGPKLSGDELLVYDNGHERGASRVAAYRLDLVARTATEVWTWGGPAPWFEFALGDVDPLPDGRVLVTQGHLECGAGTVPGDTTSLWEVVRETGEIAWRLDLQSVDDAVYRAERVDLCDAIGHVAWCPGVGERAATLGLR